MKSLAICRLVFVLVKEVVITKKKKKIMGVNILAAIFAVATVGPWETLAPDGYFCPLV